MVVSLPEMDRLQMHKDEAKQRIAMTMAGKASEIIKYGEEGVSSGPVGDIQQASGLARAMVMRWGMSDKIGNIDYAEAHEGYQGNTGGFSVSAETKRLIEAEVKTLIDEGYAEARRILLEKSVEFERLAKGLLEYETLTGDEIHKVVAGLPLDGPDSDDKPASGGGVTSIAAIPKTRGKAPKPGPEPEPAV
jgi:cell division protease FtsH